MKKNIHDYTIEEQAEMIMRHLKINKAWLARRGATKEQLIEEIIEEIIMPVRHRRMQ